MKLNSKFLITLAGVALVTPALAEESYKSETEVQISEDGSAERSVTIESETDAGSKKYESETSVDVDDDGDGERTTETKTTTDPDGLFNKSTTKTTDTVKTEDGKTSHEYEKEVDGETVEKVED